MTQTETDRAWMRRALELSWRCPPSDSAYNVGAIIVDHGVEIASGYSRETDATVHAEESALAKLAGRDLSNATMYSTLEPCSSRASRLKTCTQLIIDVGITRVVFALHEPPILAHCKGAEILKVAGVDLCHLDEFAPEVIAANEHLLGPN